MKSPNNNHLRSVGKMVKQFREWRGMKIETLSEKLSMSVKEIKAIENGEKDLSVNELSQIAEVLNCLLEIKMTLDKEG